MADVIHTEQLTKRYGRRRGLDGLDLTVRSGEVVGFLGPNGAGKTTTIHLLRPTRGQARAFGTDPHMGGVALRRRIGHLPGDFVVDGRQSVRELLIYTGNLRGGVRRERTDAIAALSWRPRSSAGKNTWDARGSQGDRVTCSCGHQAGERPRVGKFGYDAHTALR